MTTTQTILLIAIVWPLVIALPLAILIGKAMKHADRETTITIVIPDDVSSLFADDEPDDDGLDAD